MLVADDKPDRCLVCPFGLGMEAVAALDMAADLNESIECAAVVVTDSAFVCNIEKNPFTIVSFSSYEICNALCICSTSSDPLTVVGCRSSDDWPAVSCYYFQRP